MNRLCYGIILLTVLFSCRNDKKLSGTWIGAYNEFDSIKFTFRKVLQFDEDSLRIWSFYENQEIQSVGYKVEGDKILFFSKNSSVDTVGFDAHAKDSLVFEVYRDSPVFEVFEGNRNRLVFRKFKEIKSPDHIDFENKTYAYNYNSYTDSLEFISDTILLHLGKKYFDLERWRLAEIGNWKFVLIDEEMPPLFIESVNDNFITLKEYFYGGRMHLSLLKPNSYQSILVGRWKEVLRTRTDTDSDFPITPFKLNFAGDTVHISVGESYYNWRWRMDATGKYIYFPDKFYPWQNKVIWEVLVLTDEKLTIERIRRPSWAEAGKEWIEFRREE